MDILVCATSSLNTQTFFSSCLESAWCSAQCPGANQSLDP